MTVLLAYDGRPNTEKALDYAIRYSINYSVPLYILTVVSKDQMDPEDPDESVREYMEAAQRKAASEGATVHTIIEVGRPGETVVEVSELYKCDTIIVGRSNRSSLDRLFLGSVSNYVVKNSDLTVIVVSGERSEE
ncbi:MAG: universal stress protein [Candidatus Methanomethylophilaceae archaeon]|jgi:nucleotide-binding universal stress UspA family protein|nr:universal stress protein [Candidatus Methanomethylophilaceae archaeon]MBR7006581.1 universal stress protein [Candidatus Methanomethylophilaceae archaeon]